jgi:Fur family peroxide stress response transcriptional regulator
MLASKSKNAEERLARLREKALRQGLRMTPQRAVLLRVLARTPQHPTAEQLYRGVRRILPSVSPATVYRNVQMLAHAGVISTLERAGDAVRYDPNPDDHHHFTCIRCGEVIDIYLSSVEYRVDGGRSRLGTARIESYEVQFRGVCAPCRAAS